MTGINSTSVFVVSGGAKGITARCVERMAAHYGCRFILLGRSALAENDPAWALGVGDEAALKSAAMADLKARGEKPTPNAVQGMVNNLLSAREIRATLDEIRRAGGQVEYHSADITDGQSVAGVIADASSRLGPVTGIIHGAGNLADKLIENKTQKDFETVYAAKVQGLENLLNAIPEGQLQYLALFSSVAGFYGNVGQADYAIANEILNKAAYLYKKRHPACRVVSINWGPWEAGMVTPQLKAYFEANAIKVIPIEVGAHMLIEELESAQGNEIQIVVGGGISQPIIKVDSTLRTHRLRRVLELKANPFLQDHVVDGKAVLPMVCAMSWMCNSSEGLYPGFRAFGFENYKVLKGIVFDETLADEYTLELKEVEKSGEIITLDALVNSHTADGKPRFHYSARIFLRGKIPPMPTFSDFDFTVTDGTPGNVFYNDGTLFHHFSFQGVDQVLNISRERVTMRCKLPVVDARYQGQFPVHSFNYFMTDIGFQSMGIWARRFYGAGSLPLRAGGGEHYGDIPFGGVFYVSLVVRNSSETNLVTDLIIHDEQGRVYMRVNGGEVTMSTRLNELFLRNRLPEPIA